VPNTKSAKKWLRKNKKRTLHNRVFKSMAKTYIKRVVAAVKAKDLSAAEAELRLAFKRIDKCAKHNIFHPNKAARLKSRVAKMVEKLRREQTSQTAT